MKTDDFELLSRLVAERSGLQLTPDKTYLLESRLMPIARKIGVKSLDELIQMVRNNPNDQPLLRSIVEAMTTNETLFFRDTKPFDQFRTLVLPNLMKSRANKRSIRIWCAACSSGQEPYSLAILLREEGAKLADWRFEILATDISTEMLEKAKSGVYSQFEVQRGLPIQLLMKYFKQDNDLWVLSPDIRRMVQFREFNLLHDPKPLGSFDVVFCRNVLIYFDQTVKSQVLDRISHVVASDGVLYLGGAESVLGLTAAFEPIPNERGLYRLSSK